MRLLVDVQAVIHQLPGRLDAQSQEQDLVAVRRASSCQLPCVNLTQARKGIPLRMSKNPFIWVAPKIPESEIN